MTDAPDASMLVRCLTFDARWRRRVDSILELHVIMVCIASETSVYAEVRDCVDASGVYEWCV